MNMLQSLRAIHKAPTKPKGKSPRKFTEEDKEGARMLVTLFGISIASIASKIPKPTLSRWFADMTSTAEERVTVRRNDIKKDLLNGGFGKKQLAAKYGVSDATIMNDLKVLGEINVVKMTRKGRVVTYTIKG